MQKQQLKSHKAQLKDYNIEAEIGHGASGTCYKAVSKIDGSMCAIKKISINSIKGNSIRVAMKQVQVLKGLNHPNIIKYYDSFIDQGHLYIVMQYAQKGDLHAMLKRRKMKQQFYSQSQIWQMARQLLQALKYLHSKNIVHRDFKTLNIFIGEKNNLLVGDLGVSKIIKNDLGLYSRVGTPLYLAPQMIKYQKYDYKADIWGFGCVMYISTALSHPFEGKNIISLGQNILHNQPKKIANVSDQLNNFIKSLLEKNPVKRPDAKSLLLQYFSPQIQKLRNTNFSNKSVEKNEQFKNENKSKTKYNTYMDIPSAKKIQRMHPIFSSDLELKDKKNCNSYIMDEKIINNDQTVILQPFCRKIDVPQEKTRIRALFNHVKSRPSNKIIQDRIVQNQKLFQNRSKLFEKEDSQDIQRQQNVNQRYKAQNQKVQTEGHEILKRQIESQKNFLKQRIIQSAKQKNENSLQRQYSSSCQKIEKQFIISSVNRMFFQLQGQKQQKKAVIRPKSSIGRKTMVANNQIKYIKKKEQSVQNNVSHTRTQILRKPQMIII